MMSNKVSRRQFLSYSLMGVGGFMASGMLMPMVRFAVDPVLQQTGEGDYIPTPQKVDELTEVPVRVDFTIKDRQDAWYNRRVGHGMGLQRWRYGHRAFPCL